jgi:hypothetical protein
VTLDQLNDWAIMVVSGMPTRDALAYFAPDVMDPTLFEEFHNKWVRSKEFGEALSRAGSPVFQKLDFKAKLDYALKKQYSEMAYFLHSHNYAELEGPALSKANMCREALEKKVAGTAGAADPMTQWWADVASGRVQLGKGVVPKVVPLNG